MYLAGAVLDVRVLHHSKHPCVCTTPLVSQTALQKDTWVLVNSFCVVSHYNWHPSTLGILKMAGPFGMSMGGSNLFQHHLGSGAMQRSSQQQRNQNLRRLAAAGAAATAGAAGVQLYRTGRLAPLLPQRPAAKANQPLLQIPRELADVICGAFGEIVQVAILYPLDTIKVN
jgi:hypothetical protein